MIDARSGVLNFAGQAVDGNDILVKCPCSGSTNLDGKADFGDDFLIGRAI